MSNYYTTGRCQQKNAIDNRYQKRKDRNSSRKAHNHEKKSAASARYFSSASHPICPGPPTHLDATMPDECETSKTSDLTLSIPPAVAPRRETLYRWLNHRSLLPAPEAREDHESAPLHLSQQIGRTDRFQTAARCSPSTIYCSASQPDAPTPSHRSPPSSALPPALQLRCWPSRSQTVQEATLARRHKSARSTETTQTSVITIAAHAATEHCEQALLKALPGQRKSHNRE